MSHLSRKLRRKKKDTAPAQSLLCNFDVGSDTPIVSYTPDIGNLVPGHFINLLSSNDGTPSGTVRAASSDFLLAVSSGPLFYVNQCACEVNFVFKAIAGQMWYALRCVENGTAGFGVRLSANSLRLSVNAGTNLTITPALASGDLITIIDDGTTAAGALVVKINGVQVATTSVGQANNDRIIHGVSSSAANNVIDTLEITP